MSAPPATLRQLLADAADRLAAAGIDTPRVDAELLAAHAAGVDRGRLITVAPDAAFVDRFARLLARRAERIPLQHLTGRAAFGPVDLQVGPGVFIPRPETESLLEWALSEPWTTTSPLVVDLCTGSGALAVALATAVPRARVLAVDDSDDALSYARRNAVGTQVEVVRADVTDPGLLADLDGTVDLLVANPPYIPAGALLDPEVARHDPEHALFAGADGMTVIGPLVVAAARLLRPGGRCAIEHDDTTSPHTVAAFAAAQRFTDVTPRYDLAGRPRFVTAVRAG